MPSPSFRDLLGLLCLLPAIAVGLPASGARSVSGVSAPRAGGLLATFMPGCEQFSPRVRSTYVGEDKPVPRSQQAPVAVFLSGRDPQRAYIVVGNVEVLARSRNTSLDNLLDHAMREARRLGGDAIVDVVPRRAPVARGANRAPGRLVLTASVARWL